MRECGMRDQQGLRHAGAEPAVLLTSLCAMPGADPCLRSEDGQGHVGRAHPQLGVQHLVSHHHLGVLLSPVRPLYAVVPRACR